MIQQITNYLKLVLGVDIQATGYSNNHFHAFLGWNYDFYVFSIYGHSCLLAMQKTDSQLTPMSIAKNISLLNEETGKTVIFGSVAMPAYERQRLMRTGTPFIIPGRQLYLPFLAIALSEYGTKKQRTFDTIGTAAQLLLLRWLNGLDESFSISNAMAAIGYSKPSIIRAFDELEFFGAARRQGKDRRLCFLGARARQWEELCGKLTNPCRRVIGLESLPAGLSTVPCGTEALAMRSMLNPSEQRELAAFHTDYSRLRQQEIPVADAPIRLELWNYQPLVMSDGAVDPFSLWLSLKDNHDDRVQICLEEMMKEAL